MCSFTPILPRTSQRSSMARAAKAPNDNIFEHDVLVVNGDTLPPFPPTTDSYAIKKESSRTEYKASDPPEPLYPPEVRRTVEEIMEENPDRQSIHSDATTAPPPYFDEGRNLNYFQTIASVNMNNSPGLPASHRIVNVGRWLPVGIPTFAPDDGPTYYYGRSERQKPCYPSQPATPSKTAHRHNRDLDRVSRKYT